MLTTIALVNWNTRDMLLACLASVAAHAPGAAVVVVDNASTDGSAEAVAAAYPHVRLIRNAENLGFARANNQVLAAVATPYVWLLNSDTELRAGALDALERYAEARPRLAVVGSALINPDGSPQPCAFAFPSPFATWAEWLYLPGALARWRDRLGALRPRRERGATDWVLGASMLVRTAAIAEVGPLDEGYFMYSEEVDWCRRFRDAGWEVHLEPDSVVMHHGGGSTRQMPERMLVELFRSRTRYFKRTLSAPHFRLYQAMLWLGAAWNALYLTVRRLPNTSVRTQWRIATEGGRGR